VGKETAFSRSSFEFGLKINKRALGPNTAQAYRLLGHVSLDLNQPCAALAAYKQALALREQLEPPKSLPIADICDSLACAVTEAGVVSDAFAQLGRATEIHRAHYLDSDCMSARTLAIRAVTCLRAGQALGCARSHPGMLAPARHDTRADRGITVSKSQWRRHAPGSNLLDAEPKGRATAAGRVNSRHAT
jgi:hypothetical protein